MPKKDYAAFDKAREVLRQRLFVIFERAKLKDFHEVRMQTADDCIRLDMGEIKPVTVLRNLTRRLHKAGIDIGPPL